MRAVTRRALAAAIGRLCPYCGRPMLYPTRDHLRARARGGTFAEPGNGAVVCQPCNQDKGTRSLRGFLDVLIAAGDVNRAAQVAAFMARQALATLEAEGSPRANTVRDVLEATPPCRPPQP